MPHDLYCADHPVARGVDAGAAGEARADRIEQRLRELLDVRAVHAEAPDALDGRVVGRELCRLRGQRRRADQRERTDCSESAK